MKFSAQEEYGLRCLLEIARAKPGASVTIPEISRAEGLTQTHVAKLLMILRKEGFITSTRGQQGGYMLSHPAAEIRIGAVLAALGGKLYDDEFCTKHTSKELEKCGRSADCNLKSLWQVVQTAVDNVLDRVTLADLLVGSGGSNVRMFEEPPKLPVLVNL